MNLPLDHLGSEYIGLSTTADCMHGRTHAVDMAEEKKLAMASRLSSCQLSDTLKKKASTHFLCTTL